MIVFTARCRSALPVILLITIACTSEPSPSASVPTPQASLHWERMADAPTPRTEVTATSDGVVIYVAGGFEDQDETVSTVEIYDAERNEWEQGPSLPVAVNHAMSAHLDGTIYVLGGYLGPGLSNPTDQAFALRGGSWEEVAPMPEPRAAGGAAAIAGNVYVVGGVGPNGLADDMFVFDPSQDRWVVTKGPPTPREHLGVAAFGGGLFVVGGRTGGIGSNLTAAEAFDTRTRSWSTLADMPTARGGIAAAATSNGFVIAVGGEADETFDDAEAFDIEREQWLRLPPMPTARHGLGAVAVGTVLFVIAGGTEPGYSFSSTNEAIDLAEMRREV